METFFDLEWRIENLSHWCAEVHGDCIRSPKFNTPYFTDYDYLGIYRIFMELYPKDISGEGEHLVVRLCEVYTSFSGYLSFRSSDGSLLCPKQQVNSEHETNQVLPPGPKFEDVLSRIRKDKDVITVTLRVKNYHDSNCDDSNCDDINIDSKCDEHVFTTINTFKISLEINPGWIEEMESNETRNFFYIQMSYYGNLDRVWLKICSKNNGFHFIVEPPTEYEDPFAVETCVSLTGSDDTVDNCVKAEHVFRDNSPWTFPDPLEKGELDGKNISLFFRLKTKYSIESPFCMSCANSCVSIETKNKICFPDKAPSTSNKTRDSATVLAEDLMCLYQDQDFSDVSLKCKNATFPVHKNILSARSPVFKTMLSTEMKEATSGVVDIVDLDPSTLSLFLTYLYTGAVEEEQQCDRALKLYFAADKYQVPALKRDCIEFLCSNVSIPNVCDILSLSDRHSDDQLTSAAHDFILNNYKDVLKSIEWDYFMCEEPLLAVKTLTHFALKDRVRMHDPK